jgi:formate dehydrogenase assembly factor FdhD
MQKKSRTIQSETSCVASGAKSITTNSHEQPVNTSYSREGQRTPDIQSATVNEQSSTTKISSKPKEHDAKTISSQHVREFLFNKKVEEATRTLQTIEKEKSEINRLSNSSCSKCSKKTIEFKVKKLETIEASLTKYNFRVIREARKRISNT